MPKMMMQRFSLEMTTAQTVTVQGYPKPLSVQMQHGMLQIWMLVNTDQAEHHVPVLIVGTGDEMPGDPGNYVGTVETNEFARHVFTNVIGPINTKPRNKAHPAAFQNPGEAEQQYDGEELGGKRK